MISNMKRAARRHSFLAITVVTMVKAAPPTYNSNCHGKHGIIPNIIVLIAMKVKKTTASSQISILTIYALQRLQQ